MSTEFENRKREKVDTKALLYFINVSGLTRGELSARTEENGAPVSVRTISRALKGKPIELGKLSSICTVLDISVGDVLKSDTARLKATTELSSFEGNWDAQFVELTLRAGLRIVHEVNTITTSGDALKASFAPANENETEQEIVKWIKAVGDNLFGESWVEEWDAPSGIGVFHLQMSFEGQMMHGVTSWADPDSGAVEWSRYVWVRQDCKDAKVRHTAQELIGRELEFQRLKVIKRLGLEENSTPTNP